MQRQIDRHLKDWASQTYRMPLLLRGARQVGKSFSIEAFGNEHFDSFVNINFELQPELKNSFDTLLPEKILASLEILTGKSIVPGKTLLFLDEIQECPQAIMALRYFKEQMQNLHIIGAGSLLEFILNDHNFRMPVGRVQFIYLKPLSFKEFLKASEQHKLVEYLEKISLNEKIPINIHQQLLKFIKEYWIIGGMPAVVSHYLKTKNMLEMQQLQTSLLASYRHDFGKYAKHTQHQYLEKIFNKVPQLIAQDFKYVHVDSDSKSRDLKIALAKLHDAGLIQPSYASSASGLPLASQLNEKKMKLFFLDIGLIMRALQIESQFYYEENLLLINQGALAEQFVGQELLAYHDPYDEAQLFFWSREKRGSQASVDFVISISGQIIPVEVKSGKTGRLKSLHLFMEEKKSSLGIRISQSELSIENKILSVPLYLISEIPRFVEAVSSL